MPDRNLLSNCLYPCLQSAAISSTVFGVFFADGTKTMVCGANNCPVAHPGKAGRNIDHDIDKQAWKQRVRCYVSFLEDLIYEMEI